MLRAKSPRMVVVARTLILPGAALFVPAAAGAVLVLSAQAASATASSRPITSQARPVLNLEKFFLTTCPFVCSTSNSTDPLVHRLRKFRWPGRINNNHLLQAFY